uniref:Vacuolar protein sorting-associated protein 13 DH-like domain-containing protein n=1 Tax=Leptocylindrus danicus TaxID=163516 RepID=A0A7S2PQX2_9STRA
MAGDRVDSMMSVSFGLDDPKRQVKHGGGSEFLRVALAPLRSKDGLETTKLIKLKIRNEFARLSPSKLTANLEEELREEFLGIRVVGTVVADGPTRVVRFCLMQKEISTSNKLGNAVRRQAKRSETYFSEITDGAMKEAGFSSTRSSSSLSTSSSQQARDEEARELILKATFEALELKSKRVIPSQVSAQKHALAGTGVFKKHTIDQDGNALGDDDQDFAFRASFSGFVFSLIDQEPSEIAVISLQSVKMLSKWNKQRGKDATTAVSVGWLQIDNHCPNAPFPVALCPDSTIEIENADGETENVVNLPEQPVIAIGINFAPKHISEVTCLRSVTVAPRNIAVGVDLAFIVRLQRFLLGAQDRLEQASEDENDEGGELIWKYAESRELWPFPNLQKMFSACVNASGAGKESRELFFEGLTVFPYNLSLSVASPRAMTSAQAMLEGPGAAAIHAAVRKGDLLVTAGSGAGVLGVKIGRTNRTALAVVRGIFKSIIVDALLRCEEASLAFPGIGIRNYLTNSPQVTTYLLAHYLAALRSNVPSLLGSLAAFGNPLGLIRGLGDGVSDFVSEPIKGLKKSLEELDPTFVIDGVARGTGSLARHTIGGVADSASLLTQTLSKNMAVLTLDRRYAQKRDRSLHQSNPSGATPTIVDGIGTGSAKLLKGVYDGVSGVIRAPMRGAEKGGPEGFAKGVGKGLLGLVVKPVVGLSDAATDIMIGVKGSVEGGTYNDIGKMQQRIKRASQLRPRRVFYGRERTIREYKQSDATAAQLMMTTRLAGEQYFSHVDMGNAGVALLSVRRALILGNNPGDGDGNERACIKYKNIAKVDVRQIPTPDETIQWGVVVLLKTARQDGSAVEVISCDDPDVAHEIYALLNKARSLLSSISMR